MAVTASLVLTIARTDNPADVPFRLILPRALSGMLLYVLCWTVLCWPLLAVLLRITQSFALGLCIAALLGLFVPQTSRLKDAFLTLETARNHRSLTRLIQLIDEETRLYLSKIIHREERKASSRFLEEDTERRRRALDRLFEHQNVEIARELANEPSPSNPETSLNIFKVRNQPVKFKYLFRHLGYSECLRQLRVVATEPSIVLPSWPVDLPDRREAGNHASGIFGRRKYEQPEIRSYVLGVKAARIRKKYQVFVSSTYLDLKEERQQVQRVLLGADCIPAGMEFFPCSDADLWSVICGIVDECDYYILILGGRYGSVTTRGISYTQAEYEYAARKGIPILAFLHEAPEMQRTKPIPIESPEHLKRLEVFRREVQASHAPGYWRNSEDLVSRVQQAIEHAKKEQPAVGWTRRETA